jgi:hypothetical protein
MRGSPAGPRHPRPRSKDGTRPGVDRIANGRLLTLISQSFDVFVTVDRNLSFQQNLQSHSIAVIVLRGKTNRLADLRPLVPGLLAAIAAAPPGVATVIGPM